VSSYPDGNPQQLSSHPEGDPGQEPAEPARPGRKWMSGVAALVVLFVGLAGYDLISGGIASAGRPSVPHTAAAAAPRATAAASAQSATPVPGPGTSIVASPAPSASSSTAASAAPTSLLTIASAAAYGPDGPSDGDHPDLAPGVINGGDGQPWHSSWYASAEFGNLQSGTGLLLDMGETVNLSRVQLVLGSPVGADVRVQVGDASLAGELPVAASAFDAGGTVRLRLADATSGRYVLIWFTQLPPDSPGKYQVSVYGVSVYGTKRTLLPCSAEVIEQT
jgi:hypothetical protein